MQNESTTPIQRARSSNFDRDEARGVFTERRRLRRAVNRLMAKGVPMNTISVHLVDESGRRTRELPVEAGSGATRGALVGAAVGGLIGLAVVLLLALGVFGTSLVDTLGVGTVFGALRAVALGAAAGVPLGALLGMGHWQGTRRIPDADLTTHHAEVVVESPSMASVARRVLPDTAVDRAATR